MKNVLTPRPTNFLASATFLITLLVSVAVTKSTLCKCLNENAGLCSQEVEANMINPKSQHFTSRYNSTAYLQATLALAEKASIVTEDENNSSPLELHQKKQMIKQRYPTSFPDPIGCRVYLAESAIPNAGLGTYSGVDVPVGVTVTESDIPIQVTDFTSHNDDKFEFLPDHYYWSAKTTSGHFEAYSASTLLPSFGMAANSYLALYNTDRKENNDVIPRMHRSKDPGAGAVTDYHTSSWQAIKNISKGEEIFVSYGEGYFLGREAYNDVPLVDDFEVADDIVRRFHAIMMVEKVNANPKQKLWDLIRDMADTKVRNALPEDPNVLFEAIVKGTAAYSLPNLIRSTEWLEANGQCMDNLHVKPSTIPQAGRGAFATRFIPKGSLVAPVPLIQILDRDTLNTYELTEETEISLPKRKNDVVVGKQLLLNYCFGHRNTSLLLFPYSTAVQLINHKSEDYNAEIRWSNSSYHHSDWFNISIEEMTVDHSGLMFDIVATRDILPGDEVFIDYGKEWEESWNRHVEEWRPEPGAEDYVHPDEMNKDIISEVRTIEEQKSNPYPSNIQTACYYWRNASDFVTQEGEEQVLVEVQWYYDEEEFSDNYLRPCDILKRHDEGPETQYIAHVHNHCDHEEGDVIPDDEVHVVFGMPRKAIRFIGKRYTSDMFLRNAFRHSIGIPDDMIPSVWMNRQEQ